MNNSSAQLQLDILHSDTAPEGSLAELSALIEEKIDLLPQPYVRPPIGPADINYRYEKSNLYLFGDRIFPFDLPWPVLYTFFINLDWGDAKMGGFFKIKKEEADFYTIKWSAFKGTVEVACPTSTTIHWKLKGKLLGLYAVESTTILSFFRCADNQSYIYGWNVGCFPMSQFAARALEKVLFLLKYPAAATVEVVAAKVEYLVDTIKQETSSGSRYNISDFQKQEIMTMARKVHFPVDL